MCNFISSDYTSADFSFSPNNLEAVRKSNAVSACCFPHEKMRRVLIVAGRVHSSLWLNNNTTPHSARSSSSPPVANKLPSTPTTSGKHKLEYILEQVRPICIPGQFLLGCLSRGHWSVCFHYRPGAALLHCSKTSSVIRFEVSYYFCVLYWGQKYAQHSSDRLKKPQTEAKTYWSAQLPLTAMGGPLNRRHARQHMQHRVDMQLRRSAWAAVLLALKPEGWEASAGTQGRKQAGRDSLRCSTEVWV